MTLLHRASGETSDLGPESGEGDDLVVMIPVYNDWHALHLLLADLDAALSRAERRARVLVVDDGSTEPVAEDFPGRTYQALGRIDLLGLRRNVGHQRAIAIGLAYVEQNIPCRALVLMDGDGEDAPADVPRLLDKFEREGERKIIFAERTRRSESRLFRVFYALYKTLHLLLTGHAVRVGNFSVIPRERLASLAVVSEVWNHYAAAVFRSQQPYDCLPTRRAPRLSGRSKMNFTRLVVHGLSALSVYSDIIGVRLLAATMVLIVLTLAGLVATVAIRLGTTLAIPGWATNLFSILLVILLQALMFSMLFAFIILGGRQGSAFLPCRDYAYYVGRVRTLYRDPAHAR
jgi:glycosyltransferase involved in cell wall biosynthesis